ncbi:2-keto-4-pentenoate hydratase [Gemmatimonas sp.]|uniref:2-keto-4-pentenoate hydratase n=1 Tax=Gemmatimonas sp. TaxID=1962908 RepID=UPI003561E975
MTLPKNEVEHWAEVLAEAVRHRTEMSGISKSLDLSPEDAYAIQSAGIELRTIAGERIVGAKAGLTSRAKQLQMGVDAPIYGVLTEGMLLAPGDPIPIDQLIHPRCEPELVFLIGHDLAGNNVTADDVLDCTDSVRGGIEVIDSRYARFEFTFADVIADNTSAAKYLVGSEGVSPRSVDLREIRCSFSLNGEVVGTATGDALLGDPAECVAALVRHLAFGGSGLCAGDTVLAGGLMDAIAIQPGDVIRASYSAVEDVEVTAQ